MPTQLRLGLMYWPYSDKMQINYNAKDRTVQKIYSGPVKILDGLYMGDEEAAKDMDFVDSNKVTHIINTVAQRIPDSFSRDGVVYLSLYWGEKEEKIFDAKNNTLHAIENFVQQALEQGQSTLVVSPRGRTRAATVVVAYLLGKYKWGLGKCLEFMRVKCEGLLIKQNFLKQLQIVFDFSHKSSALSDNWDCAQDEEQRTIVNTYKNMKKSIIAQEVAKPKISGKKVAWRQNLRSPALYSPTKFRNLIERKSELKLKPILKNDPDATAYEDAGKVELSLESISVIYPVSKTSTNQQPSAYTHRKRQSLSKTQTLNDQKRDSCRLTANNFFSAATTEPSPGRANSSSIKYTSCERKGREFKMQNRSGARLTPYENIFSSLKTPYDTPAIGKLDKVESLKAVSRLEGILVKGGQTHPIVDIRSGKTGQLLNKANEMSSPSNLHRIRVDNQIRSQLSVMRSYVTNSGLREGQPVSSSKNRHLYAYSPAPAMKLK